MIAKANNNYPKGYTAKETTFNFVGMAAKENINYLECYYHLPSRKTINLMLPLPRRRPLP